MDRGRSKSNFGHGCSPDRISSLPDNIIHRILRFIPIREAARTSTLSREWRYIWTELPELVLDKQFSEDIMRKKSPTKFQDYYANLVNEILLHHLGSITKFVLHVPKLPTTKYSNIDKWMQFLSRQGLQELTCINSSPIPYKIPSDIFSCPKLSLLKISNCIFEAPSRAFKGFRRLTALGLYQITFESSVVISASELLYLIIERSRGIRHSKISAPKLRCLFLIDNDDLELSHFMNCSMLETAYVALSKGVEYQRLNERINLTKLLSCWPKLSRLCLDGSLLKCPTAGSTIPEKLPSEMNCLTKLVFFRVNYDLDQIKYILCLLRSSINLSRLEIWASKVIKNDAEIVDYLEQPGLARQIMNGLGTVKMIRFQGSTPELLFVKLLLANCPSIERMHIQEKRNRDPTENLRTIMESMQFSRAPPKAELIFQPGIQN